TLQLLTDGCLVNEFWPTLFLNHGDDSIEPNHLAALEILASEPAFVEATAGAGLRYLSPDLLCKRRAAAHNHRAVNILIRCASLDQAYSEGFLGTVLTMAIEERLAGNESAWNIHMSGA